MSAMAHNVYEEMFTYKNNAKKWRLLMSFRNELTIENETYSLAQTFSPCVPIAAVSSLRNLALYTQLTGFMKPHIVIYTYARCSAVCL